MYVFIYIYVITRHSVRSLRKLWLKMEETQPRLDCENCRRSKAKKLAWLNLAGEYMYVCRGCTFQIVLCALEDSEPVGDANLDMDKLLKDATEEDEAELMLTLQEANAGDSYSNYCNEEEREMERQRGRETELESEAERERERERS